MLNDRQSDRDSARYVACRVGAQLKPYSKIIRCVLSVLAWGLVGLVQVTQAADTPAPLTTAQEQKGTPPEGGDVPPEAGGIQERRIKILAGHTYCVCTCNTPDFPVLTWEKVASCALNGRSCRNSSG